MNIRYRSIPNFTEPGEYLVLPLLQVSLRYGSKGRRFLALVDSGAGGCLFPASMGTLLGINVPTGQPKTYYGIAGQSAPGFVHSVELQVTGFDQWMSINAGFVDRDILPLLGQSGFFENYQIVFERYKRQFEVNTKTDALIRNRRGHGRG